jgi:hypothetical protein
MAVAPIPLRKVLLETAAAPPGALVLGQQWKHAFFSKTCAFFLMRIFLF